MELGCGPLPVLQTLRDKEPFSRRGGFRKERVIVPDGASEPFWSAFYLGSDAPLFVASSTHRILIVHSLLAKLPKLSF